MRWGQTIFNSSGAELSGVMAQPQPLQRQPGREVASNSCKRRGVEKSEGLLPCGRAQSCQKNCRNMFSCVKITAMWPRSAQWMGTAAVGPESTQLLLTNKEEMERKGPGHQTSKKGGIRQVIAGAEIDGQVFIQHEDLQHLRIATLGLYILSTGQSCLKMPSHSFIISRFTWAF